MDRNSFVVQIRGESKRAQRLQCFAKLVNAILLCGHHKIIIIRRLCKFLLNTINWICGQRAELMVVDVKVIILTRRLPMIFDVMQ